MKIGLWMIVALIICVVIIGALIDMSILNSDLPDIWKWYLLK